MVKKNNKKKKVKPNGFDKGTKRIGKHGLTTNLELMQIASELGFPVEVVSKNHLTDKPTRNGNYIINLQDSDEGGGSHWVGLIIYPKIAFYYDSFGFLPPLEVIYFVNPNSAEFTRRELYIADKQIQNQFGAYCGQYVSDFLRFMNEGKGTLKRFNEYLDMWEERE